MRALPAECAQIYVGRERDAPSASSVREDTGSVGARTGGNLSDSTLPSRRFSTGQQAARRERTTAQRRVRWFVSKKISPRLSASGERPLSRSRPREPSPRDGSPPQTDLCRSPRRGRRSARARTRGSAELPLWRDDGTCETGDAPRGARPNCKRDYPERWITWLVGR